MAFKNILVPVDFTDTARRALQIARGLALETGGQLTVLHIGIPGGQVDALMTGSAAGVVYQDLARKIEAEQQDVLDKLVQEELPGDAPAAETLLRRGDPATEILALLEEGRHDLLVMGTHGRKGLARVLLGSVAEQVLRDSPVPVLLTK